MVEWLTSFDGTTWLCSLHAPSLKSALPLGANHFDPFESLKDELFDALPSPFHKDSSVKVKEPPNAKESVKDVAQNSAEECSNYVKEAGPRGPLSRAKSSATPPVPRIRDGDPHIPSEKKLIVGKS